MLRFYLRVVILSLLMFTAALLTFRIQPYDDSDLRAIIAPADCDAPCFMGIRPGLTTAQEAQAILKTHPWVDAVTYVGTTSITWRWNGQQPAWINPATEGLLIVFNNQVLTVQFNSVMPFGHILLGLGDHATLNQSRYQSSFISGNYVLDEVTYLEHHLRFVFIMDCSHHLPYLRTVNVIIDRATNEQRPDDRQPVQHANFGCSR